LTSKKENPWDVCAQCGAIYDTRVNPDERHGCNSPLYSASPGASAVFSAPVLVGGMSKSEYFAFHQEFCRRMGDITAAKNADYTGNSDDPFANFTIVETFGAMTTEQGFFARMTDKLARVSSFIQNGELQVKSESVEDTLLDLSNYCALFAGYLRSKAK
jgi:hypothetical protein